MRLSKPPNGFDDVVGVGLDELRLIVSIEDRTVKQSAVLRSFALGKVNDGVLELDDAKEAASWSGETRVHVAVVLAKQRKVVVGLAHRVGSWVARKPSRRSSVVPSLAHFDRSEGADWAKPVSRFQGNQPVQGVVPLVEPEWHHGRKDEI